jgi:hypothetical protein
MSGFRPLDFYLNPKLLSIVILTDFHYNRIKDNLERVLMHSRVPLNSYNVNAKVNKVNTVIKQKS